MKKIAICIPTYNRQLYLQECINSILSDVKSNNLNTQIEICISDNCSTDDTESMISTMSSQTNVQIIYHRNNTNIGPDLNYLKCIEIASAEYCWFMGSDDAITHGSIVKVMDELKSYQADVYIGNRILCDQNLKPIKNQRFFKSIKKTIFNTNELDSYFLNSISLGAVFSYLSSIVVKKSKWDSIEYNEEYTGTAYPHVFIILSFLLNKNSILKIIPYAIVLCRTGNDSFLTQGVVKRFLIDVDGYLKLANDLFKNDQEMRFNFLGILRSENGFLRLLKMRSLTPDLEWGKINNKLRECGFNNKVLFLLNNNLKFVSFIIRQLLDIRAKIKLL
ncbi:MAG: glycosyltransferase family 2 protein [Sphingobacteriaceae bacterium]|nr:MAG: glycosyltransferase family 2 protein [Sphingobacteriaceae bacterium]